MILVPLEFAAGHAGDDRKVSDVLDQPEFVEDTQFARAVRRVNASSEVDHMAAIAPFNSAF